MRPKKTKKPSKRTIKPADLPRPLPVYDTLQQAHVGTGIPLAAIKKAKREGCPAFRHNRVHLADLLPWLFRSAGDGIDVVHERARRERAEADIAETKARRARGELVEWSDIDKLIVETFSPVREQVTQMPAMLCSRCNPSDPQHAKSHLDEWAAGFLKHVREHRPPSPATNHDDQD